MKNVVGQEVIWWEEFNKLPCWMKHIFDRIVMFSDSWGRTSGNAEHLKSKVFPLYDDLTVEAIETAVARLSLVRYTDNKTILDRYEAGAYYVLQVHTGLWEKWHRSTFRLRKPSDYPDDPKYVTLVQQEFDGDKSLPQIAQQVCDYWNNIIKRTPKAAWTSQRVQETVGLLTTSQKEMFRGKRGLGWTVASIHRTFYNLDELSRNPMMKAYYLSITMEEFLEKHAERFLNMTDAREYALRKSTTYHDTRYSIARERLHNA